MNKTYLSVDIQGKKYSSGYIPNATRHMIHDDNVYAGLLKGKLVIDFSNSDAEYLHIVPACCVKGCEEKPKKKATKKKKAE